MLQKALIALIIILAAFLRLWNLPNNPPGLTWDEAALGYNAYSILKTARDEYGTFLPLNFKSFGDYKPGFYIYLDVPFVAIFGLNELAVRLPSALFGILGVLGAYLLVNELFKNRWLALSAGFFLAISPWHIQYSRPAFEANVALTFNIFAAWCFLKGLNNRKWSASWRIFSALLFGLSILTYQSSKLFVPILIILLLLIFRKSYSIKNLTAPALIMVVFLAIIGWTLISGQASRLQTVNFFAYQRSSDDTNLIAKEDSWPVESIQFQVLHGQWFEYIKGLTERYLIYFSPKMLFIDGDYQQRERVPDLGTLYYFSVILIPLGLWRLLRGWRGSGLVLGWLLLAPIPAVLSRDLITTLRSLNMVVPWAVLEGAGLMVIINGIKSLKGFKYLGYGLVALVIVANFAIFLDRYFVHAPKEYSAYWLYGYKQTMTGLNNEKNNFDKVVVTDVYGQPYIYYLFYNQYPPDQFQKQAVLDQPGTDVGTVRKIDNIEFRHIYWPNERGDKNSLFIGSEDELPDKDIQPNQAEVVKQINFLDGLPAFKIVETVK